MTFFKYLMAVAMFTQLLACAENTVTLEEVEKHCADLERSERERCLQYHMGSLDQQRREELRTQE